MIKRLGKRFYDDDTVFPRLSRKKFLFSFLETCVRGPIVSIPRVRERRLLRATEDKGEGITTEGPCCAGGGDNVGCRETECCGGDGDGFGCSYEGWFGTAYGC